MDSSEIKIGNHHRQDKLLELLLEFNPNNELAKRIYDDGYHYENDKQYIQEDLLELKEFIDRAKKLFGNNKTITIKNGNNHGNNSTTTRRVIR